MPFHHPLLPAVELDRQTAKDVDEQRAASYDILQFKYDGIWSCFDGHTIISRNGLAKDTHHVARWPAGTLLAGEFMYGSQWAQNPERLGKLYAYDLLMLNGEDLRAKTYQVRYAALRDLLHILSDKRLPIVNTYTTANNIQRVVESLKRTRAYEGFVVRNWSQPYTDPIGRFKLDVTDDYVIMNVNEGERANVGRMGSVTVGQYVGDELVPIMDVGGGWSNEQRQYIFDHPQGFINKVIEVSGKVRFESGAFRHSNFERFREDKSPRECRFVKPATSNVDE